MHEHYLSDLLNDRRRVAEQELDEMRQIFDFYDVHAKDEMDMRSVFELNFVRLQLRRQISRGG